MSHINKVLCDCCGKEHPVSDHLPPRWVRINEDTHVCGGTCLAEYAIRVVHREKEQDRQLDSLVFEKVTSRSSSALPLILSKQ